MKIIKIINEKYQQNNYLIVNGEDAFLIDASAYVSLVEENLKIFNPKPKLRGIFLTHEHFDHISELDNLVAKFGCPVFIHDNGKNSLYKESENLSILDVPFKIKEKKQIKTFEDGDEFTVGDMVIKCCHTPGHSRGSSCFIVNDNMFVGDNVFKMDIGRNDLFGGDKNIQKISLERIKNELSVDIQNFYPGHGVNFNKSDLEYNLNHFAGEK